MSEFEKREKRRKYKLVLTSSTLSSGYPWATIKLRNHLSPLITFPFGAMSLLELPSPFVFQPAGR